MPAYYTVETSDGKRRHIGAGRTKVLCSFCLYAASVVCAHPTFEHCPRYKKRVAERWQPQPKGKRA